MARKNKPLPEVAWLQPRLALSRAISLGSFVGLVLLILIRDLIYADAHGAASWVPWLTKSGREAITTSFSTFEIWFCVAALYLLLNLPLSHMASRLERRLGQSD